MAYGRQKNKKKRKRRKEKGITENFVQVTKQRNETKCFPCVRDSPEYQKTS